MVLLTNQIQYGIFRLIFERKNFLYDKYLSRCLFAKIKCINTREHDNFPILYAFEISVIIPSYLMETLEISVIMPLYHMETLEISVIIPSYHMET